MDSHLRQLIKSNDMPSDATIKVVKELMEKPTQELTEIDEEIRRLEQAVQALEVRRRPVQKAISTYNTILSPARRLPSDVLREIFFHCLPTLRNSIMSYSESPLLLTHVSSLWRSTALTSPRIWSRLYIPLPRPMATHQDLFGAPMYTESQYADKMEKRQQELVEWLSKSGSYPLSLSIHYPSSHTGDEEGGWDSHTENLANVIIHHAGRWRELELVLPLDIYERFQAKFTVDMVPLLHTLRVTFTRKPASVFPSTPIPLLGAPGLKSLSLNMMGSQWTSYPSTMWRSLTYLRVAFHSSVHEKDVLPLLKACPNLVTCRLTVAAAISDPSVATEPPSKDTVFLPHLETLSINGASSGLLAAECHNIVSPVLRSLVLTLSVHPMLPHDQWMLPPFMLPHLGVVAPSAEPAEPALPASPTPIFVQNAASTIRYLNLQPATMCKQDIQQCLKLPIYLQHLVLGDKPATDPAGSLIYTLESMDWFQTPQKSQTTETSAIESLAVTETSDKGDEGEEILLPYLEVFESYHLPLELSDKSLARFICSRLRRIRSAAGTTVSSSLSSPNASSPNLPPLINGVAVLRKVCVKFNRPREVDITDEVQEAAMAAGVDFVLDLSYPPVQPRRPDPLSALHHGMAQGFWQ